MHVCVCTDVYKRRRQRCRQGQHWVTQRTNCSSVPTGVFAAESHHELEGVALQRAVQRPPLQHVPKHRNETREHYRPAIGCAQNKRNG